MWEMIKGLNHKFSLPWVCARDFNEILKGHEKLGGEPKREYEMKAFRNVVDECELVDLGYTELKFKWRGNRPNGVVLERLNHALANTSWLELNLATHIQHFKAHSSDHNPILIKLEGIAQYQNKLFHFE
nr:hypothetical protein CFP56_77330 [Quercus suber]